MRIFNKTFIRVSTLMIGISGIAMPQNGVASTKEVVEKEPIGEARLPMPAKSIAFYVGHELTEDGSTLLGGFGHEPSSHWIDIVPSLEHPEGSTMTVGVTEDANIPGELSEIPQVEKTNKYISSTYSEFEGFPPPLTNGGLNEHGVGARDVWSTSRQELVDMTPEPQTGPNYSDLSRIAMERATTAREAVEIIGGLIDEYGYSTYGGNSHLFADENEGWVFIEFAGGEGLWAAERLGPDEVRVSYPGYINEFPTDFEDSSDYMGSPNIVDFAIDQGWHEEKEETIDLQEAYGVPFPGIDVDPIEDHYIANRIPYEREEELRAMAPVSLEDMLAHVRDPRWSNDAAGYGQVAHIRPDVHNELQTLWLATTGSISTPYVPIPIAAEDVPMEFKQHRYMTKDADSYYLNADYAVQEATRSAVQEFKRVMYLACDNPQRYLHEVTGEIEAFEIEELNERASLEQEALELFEAGNDAEARALINDNVHQRLTESLQLGMELSDRIETDMRENGGLREPAGEELAGETTLASSQSMSMYSGEDRVSCYDPDLDEYPREHGIYSEVSTDDDGMFSRIKQFFQNLF